MNEFERIGTVTYEEIATPELDGMIRGVNEYWAQRSYQDVLAEMPEPTVFEIDNGKRAVELVEVKPVANDHDFDNEIVMGLPYLNGYTPHHYIRAKTLQLLTNPNASVWIVPNNTHQREVYSFTDEEKAKLVNGDIRPLGEVQIRAFEQVNKRHKVGSFALTGYSQGALTALAMSAVGSDKIHIDRVNADETPSKTFRNAKALSRDFLKSGGMGDLRGAVKDADIHALSQAMSIGRLGRDLVRFGIMSKTAHGKLMNEAMTGSADALVEEALGNGVILKLGAVAGSALFDPTSIEIRSGNLYMIQYEGKPFDHKHATGDNVKAHAIMARHGLEL